MITKKTYVVCIRNDGYEGSLELRKLYEVLEDVEAAADGLLRVVDEDEDYLYPASWFIPIPISHEIEKAIVATTRSA
ncbi:MAG TPA: hypothetical protein VMS12_01525 [Thermoanaerobaculia bacterium]|nr:hypothetical protein [Thermoanaerobaculia bacterium]